MHSKNKIKKEDKNKEIRKSRRPRAQIIRRPLISLQKQNRIEQCTLAYLLNQNNQNCTFVFVSNVFFFSFLDFEFRKKNDDDGVEKKNIELRGTEEEII